MKKLQRQINRIQSKAMNNVLAVAGLVSNLCEGVTGKKKYSLIALLAGVTLPLTSAFASLPLGQQYTLNGKGGYLWEETLSAAGSNALTCGTSKEIFYSWARVDDGHETTRTSDGKFGLKIGTDLVLTLSGGVRILGNGRDLTMNYSDNSAVTFSGPNASDAQLYPVGSTFVNIYGVSVGSKNFVSVTSNSSIGSLKVGLYAGPLARAGTYTVPSYLITFGCGAGRVDVSDAGTLSLIKPSLDCTVSAPAAIAFGRVNITGASNNQLLATQKKGIDINCTSDDPLRVAEQMKISFSGEIASGSWSQLPVKNSNGQIMGNIRGRYLDAEGLCAADSANQVGFNGSSGTKTINNVGVGLTNIPITWSLCGNNSGLLGDGSATATVKIDWD